jgi:hypothetical protein
MRKLTAIIGVAALLATVSNINAGWLEFVQKAGNSKQLTATVYPSYVPGLKLEDGRKAEWGVGAALMYPLGTDHVLGGVRVDYLADQLWMPSVTITPNADVQLFGHNFTAFATAGAIVPLGKSDEEGDVGATVGAGIFTTVWKPSEAVSLQLWAAYERWMPVLDVNVYHAGVALTVKF